MEIIDSLCENDEKIIKDYKFVKNIGKGAFGYVYEAIHI